MDKLEKQIIENRAELDRYIPDPGIWNQIQEDQSKIRSLRYRKIGRWAAIFLVVLTTTMIFLSAGSSGLLSLGNSDGIPTHLIETENYYSDKVNSLIEKARPILTEYPALNRDLMTEIENLDILYFEIRKDLKDNVSNDEVIEALIRNYKAKIQILEEILDILNESGTNNEKNANYEI